MSKKRRPSLPIRPVIKLLDESSLIVLRLTVEEYELLFDVLEHVYDLDWDAFAEEANDRRRTLAESVGDKLEPKRTLTPETFEKIFGSLLDKRWGGCFGGGPTN